MVKAKKLSERIGSLAQHLMRHKKLYYAGNPEISDIAYDQLEDELRSLAPQHPVLSYVGSEVVQRAQKVPHASPMLSLQKTYLESELKSWMGTHPVVGTWKVDGNSLSVVYQGGQISLAKTRGNGRIGEDVTNKALWVPDLVPQLGKPYNCEIRGELFCSEHHFAELVDEMLSRGLERPSNPRNIVAGLLGRRSHVDLARYFNFLAFDVISDDPALQFNTEMGKFSWLENLGFSLPHPKLLGHPKDLNRYLDEVKTVMAAGDIGLDGAVFSFDDVHLHQELGSTSHHPRYKISFKWQGQTAIAKIEAISWATSRLGVVTPVAVIEPVTLSGAQIKNITLHNAEHVMAYNLKAGDQIEIVRSGEVIPKFLEVKVSAPGQYQWPSQCPSCQGPLEFDGVRLKCLQQENCGAQQMGFVLNWIRCGNIDDLSEKRLTSMMELGLVEHVADLYELTLEDLLLLPLTKEKMAQKLLSNIQASKKLPLASFLNGLGIEGAGQTSWEKILEFIPTLSKLRKASVASIMAIDGFAEKSAQQIVRGLQEKSATIDALLAVGVKPTPPKAPDISGPIAGKSLVITGTLSRPRGDIEAAIKNAGGKTSSSVSKNTYALITNDQDSGSSKMKKAQALGIQIWDEAKLFRILE